MSANPYRMSLRFQQANTVRRLQALKRELRKKTGKKITLSSIVEGIVEQFLDKENSPLGEKEDEIV